MKYVAWLFGVLVVLALGAWLTRDQREPKAAAAHAAKRARKPVEEESRSVITAPIAARARRLLPSDRELIEPELSSQTGTLGEPEASKATYALRLEKRTLALGEPVQALLSVRHDAGAVPVFRIVSKDIVRRDDGESEPGGSWNEQPTAEGVHLTWVPGEFPAPTGPRELVLVIDLAGEQHSLSAEFAVASGSPLTLTGKVVERRRTGVLEIDVEVESKVALACELMANLFDRSGTPLQHTTYSGNVGPGAAHVVLEFSQDIQADTHTLSSPIVVRQFRGSCRRVDDPLGTALPIAFSDELYRTP